MYERLGTLRDDDALRPWIAQVARRICIDRLAERGRAAHAERASSTRTLAEPATEDELAGIEEAMDVHEALAGLEPPCREMLDRFFARDEPYRVIADALDLPMGTVASRISRCLDKLRTCSSREEIRPPSGLEVERHGGRDLSSRTVHRRGDRGAGSGGSRRRPRLGARGVRASAGARADGRHRRASRGRRRVPRARCSPISRRRCGSRASSRPSRCSTSCGASSARSA